MKRSFEFYNSWWRNLVLALICAPFSIGLLVLGGSQIYGDVRLALACGMFGTGTVLFGYRFIDRRLKVKVDESGVCDFRARYGVIPWNEIAAYSIWSVKGNDYLTLTLRTPEVWLSNAPAITRAMVKLFRKRELKVTVALQNMVVDENALRAFMSEMMSPTQSRL